MRNTVGWDFHPATGALYFDDNSIDRLGDNAPGEPAWQQLGCVLPGAADFQQPQLALQRYCTWLAAASSSSGVKSTLAAARPAADCELNRLALAGPFPQNFGHPFCYS